MDQNQNLFSLSIDPVTKAHLNDTAKWARFLAIVGMVFLGLIVIAAFFGLTMTGTSSVSFQGVERSDEMVNVMRVAMIGISIAVTVIAFFPLLFLLQFANRMRRSLAANDQEELNHSFQNLKKYFRYLGIITIIFLAFYGIIFVLGIMGSALVS
jgi:small-conductance mechanosensitive channel